MAEEQGMQTSRMTPPHTSAYRPVQVMKDDDGDAYLQKKETRIDKDDVNFWSQKRERRIGWVGETSFGIRLWETIWGKECVRWNAAAPFVFLIYSQEQERQKS